MAEVKIDTREFEQKLAEHINENALAIAQQIARDARASVNVVTGNLKKSIRAKKSKFPDGGWIVVASAPHSFIIEYGRKNAPAFPFLRPALDKNIALARQMFGAE